MGMLKEALSPIEIHQPGCLHLQHLHEPIPAYACADDSVLVREAEKASGRAAESVNYCTEAPFIQQLGCETIVMGPGHITRRTSRMSISTSPSSSRPPRCCST